MLEIKNVTKTYAGSDFKALDNVNIKVQKGEFVGLLGPNGAGKSTLINAIVGHVIKDSGQIEVKGYDLDKAEIETKRLIGVVPQEISFDSFFTVNEVLINQSGYFGLKNNQAYIDELLYNLSLYDKKNVNTRALSGGMKRRLLIAKAMVHKPEIIILDEPTAGVDIELRQNMYKFLRNLQEHCQTIILTTHYLEEAEYLCERIIIINHGKIIIDQNKHELMERLGGNAVLTFNFSRPIRKVEFPFLKEFQYKTNEQSLQVKLYKKDIKKLFEIMVENKVDYETCHFEDDKLEDVFLELIHNGHKE